ncbi:rCG44888 [Rattus norvegicus]|uniref:RCG44888 n=1 Tax=Rattus norvegicus TaxID=10116 RepID=A6KK09_RAT|nr:rCG44888 [Rattus norvegicus]
MLGALSLLSERVQKTAGLAAGHWAGSLPGFTKTQAGSHRQATEENADVQQASGPSKNEVSSPQQQSRLKLMMTNNGRGLPKIFSERHVL